MEVPVNQEENLRFRAKLLEKCEEDLELREVVKECCKRDVEFFFDAFLWTFNPKLGANSNLPFILYPKQRELVRVLDDMLERSSKGELINLLLDKPRDVGATFVLMGWCLKHFLFGDFNARVGSRKEDYVDKKGEADSLFFKLDYMIERLPRWILPNGFSLGRNRSSMMLRGSGENAISGESANPNFGRGGRKSCTIFDELGFWEWAKSSWDSSGESTNFRICMSTPPESGKDSFFYKLRAGKAGKVHIFEFDWRDVPGRDEAWLAEKKINNSEEAFAREIMKSYDGTIEGKVYAANLKLANIGTVEYNPRLPLFCTWDVGLDGTAIIWIQKTIEGRIRIIDCYCRYDYVEGIDFFVPFITGQLISTKGYIYQDWELEKIKRHASWSSSITHYGDPSINQRHNSTGKSTFDVLSREHQIYIQTKDWAGREWNDLRLLTLPLFRRMDIDEKNCEPLLSALRNARYPKRAEGSNSTSGVNKPIHDSTSHLRSALEYFADNEPDRIEEESDDDYYEESEDERTYNLIADV